MTKGRPRLGKGGHTYTPATTVQWEAYIREILVVSCPGLTMSVGEPLGVRLVFVTKTRQRRDVDNLAKLVMDACTGYVWADDSQVDELLIRAIRGSETPATYLVVYRLEHLVPLCERCGQPIPPQFTQGRFRRNDRFCSKPCYDDAQRKGAYQSCFVCGARIYCQNWRLETSARFFCTSTCKALANSQEGICRHCRSVFRAYRSRRKPFCSPACADAWHASRPRRSSHRVGACRSCGGPTSRATIARCQTCFRASQNGASYLGVTTLSRQGA